MSKEASFKSLSLLLDRITAANPAKLFVVCDQQGIAPVGGGSLPQQGSRVFLETFPENTLDRWLTEIRAVVEIDPSY